MDHGHPLGTGVPDASRSRVLARAAALNAEDCRRLYAAYQALALGSYLTRFIHALPDPHEAYQGPILVARADVDRIVDPALRTQVHDGARSALERAAGGWAAAPGDPRRLRTLVRRIGVLGSWALAAVLGVVLMAAPWAAGSWPALAFGAVLIVAAAATAWVVAVPNRALALTAAVESATYAELLRDQIPTDVAELLEQPWREALGGLPLPARGPLDRLAGWVGAVALLSMVVGFAGLVAGSAVGGLQEIGWLLIVGIALCFAAPGIAGVAALRRFVSRRSAGPGAGLQVGQTAAAHVAATPLVSGTFAGLGTPALTVLAAIVGGLVFGAGDAAKDLAGWLLLGSALAIGAAIGWAVRPRLPLLGYVAGGLVGTSLSVAVRIADQPGLDLGAELVASGVVGILALVAGGIASRVRTAMAPESG